MPVSVSVNVSLLQKDRFFKGKKGVYADLVLWETAGTDAEEYGDYIVKQKADKGEKMPILGNAKNFTLKGAKKKARPDHDEDEEDDDGEIPF
jgi:hypothetical protein